MIPQVRNKIEKKCKISKKNSFLEIIYQLKKTSDYSQNDPPGPEQKLEEKKTKFL